MQRYFVVTWLVVALGCSDDGGNKTAPDTALVEVPDAISNQGRVRILFEARGNANAFLCTLDGHTSTCISPFEADVADGEHTFEVAAALNANVDETPAVHVWRVDTVAPDTTITSAPPALDNSITPEIVFASDDTEVTFECSLDGEPFAPCTTPTTLTVVDGPHEFSVRATDAAGNVDPTPATHGWTIDATAPETTILNGPVAGGTTGPSGSFTFSSPEAGATFECSLDGAAFTACTSPRAFASLADGAHTFAVRAKDTVGIVDPSPATRTWTVDAVGPPVTITSTPANPSNDTTPTFAFTSTDATATFQCQIDNVVAFTACTSPWTGPTTPAGGRTFRVRGTDAFGNVGAAATFAWTIDTTPPSVTLSSQPAALSNDTTPTVTFTTAGSPVSTECRLDSGAFAACTSPFTTTAGEGMHTITVRVTDAAGNTGSATTNSFVIDITPPSVSITGQPAALSNDTTPTVTFTSAGNPTSTQCRLDNGTFTSCTSPFTTTAGAGMHTISVRVTDAAGNSATAVTNTFTIDTTPPSLTITGQPAALSNNNDPQVVFTTDGVSTQCRLDAATPVTCSSPHTFTNVADGAHTITVIARDAAGNTASATTSSFTIDTVAPALAFTETAPASWPVNYFDFRFTTGDAVTVTCAVDGGAFAACASPRTVTVTYNVSHTFSVRGVDAAGNIRTITAPAWTPTPGLVLHYPWEQGDTDNTSLLKQRASHSPDGVTASVSTFVGGWAGSALGSTVSGHQYAGTARALSSSADGTYTASFWIRSTDAASAQQILSTVGTSGSGGLRVSLTSGSQLTFTAFENGQSQQFTTTIAEDRWVHVAMRTTGPGKGLEVFVDGMPRGAISTFNGFDAGQATNMTVGSWQQLDVDDLRFFNLAFGNTEICTQLARGFFAAGGPCVPLAPGFEIDFENDRIVDTGLWNLLLIGPSTGTFGFAGHTLGDLLRLVSQVTWGYDTLNGPTFSSQVAAAPGRSFTFSFIPGTAFGRIIDFTRPCNAAGGLPMCGISVAYVDDDVLQIYTGTPSEQKTTSIGVAGGVAADRFNNVVVTEQRGANGTVSLTVYVNLKATVIPITGGDIYGIVNNQIFLATVPSLPVDEYEFWATDLSTSAERLCENGADGEWDVVTNSCLLTAGP